MCQIILESVICEFSLDAVSWTTHTGSLWASTLNHKSIDHTMEDQAIIKTLLYKTDKIIYSIRCNFRRTLHFIKVAADGHWFGNDIGA